MKIFQPTMTGSFTVTGSVTVTGSLNTTGNINGSTPTELGYLSGSVSNIQNQIFSRSLDIIVGYQSAGSNFKAIPIGTSTDRFNQTLTALVSQTIRIQAVLLPTNTTLTGIATYVGTLQSGGTSGSYNGVGLYTLSGTTLTCVASSSNNSTLWSGGSANSYVTQSFGSTYSAVAGLYYAAILYNYSLGTAPTVALTATVANANILIPGLSTNNRLTANLTSQTSMPSSIATSTITSATALTNLALY